MTALIGAVKRRLGMEVYDVQAQEAGDQGPVRVHATIDGVDYYGRGRTTREALQHFCDVVGDHGAPVPGGHGGSSERERLAALRQRLQEMSAFCDRGWSGDGDRPPAPPAAVMRLALMIAEALDESDL